MCNYDLRTMYLMDNERPSYKTFFEFINEVILPNQYVIFTKICNTIIETFQLNITNQYLMELKSKQMLINIILFGNQ